MKIQFKLFILLCLILGAAGLWANTPRPVTPNASPEAKALLNYIYSIKGEKILSGQQGMQEPEYIKEVTGYYPAIKGHDFIHENQNKDVVASVIDWWNKGGIPTVMWHWGAPSIGQGYENSKKLIDIERCFQEGTPENKAMWSDLKRIADYLTMIRDANVPIIWRPMHECDGDWFWYGKGTGEQYNRLWRTMFDYFTKERGLNNLIWVLCHTGDPTAEYDPGEEYYDIAGADSYSNEQVRKEMYDKVKMIHGDIRPIAYHECGTLPDPDKCKQQGVDWSWFMLWSREYCTGHDKEELKRIYDNDRVLTLDELPNIMDYLPDAPNVYESNMSGSIPLVDINGTTTTIYFDAEDYPVVGVASNLFADDVERVTGNKPEIKNVAKLNDLGKRPAIVAGTIGKSRIIDELVAKNVITADDLNGKWEAFTIATAKHPKYGTPLLVVAGSDRRGTAFGLTTLSEAIGVSPWYWWADVTPSQKEALYVEPGVFHQGEPSVQYRGIFLNDERFGGWALWSERNFDKESGKVGPKVYQKVFELLLRLKANYLWPAMHPGTQAFNADPENARLADEYAIVMGTSHCEQMLRNNEDEWKAKGIYGDFNYITNRQTMKDYWEERVKTNGKYENTYTLGLRGIHDYPMEGANTTAERVQIMQQAINDQREMLTRNIDKPIEEIPQVLCTYEEVLDAYHNGLEVPEDVTLLWSDDKHGYTRNLSNPDEQKRKGGAGIYYHISYHGDPASWIWLSPLSPAFLSNELTKAYDYGARKIWIFNVGDIKPAEKEISFVMELARNIDRWSPDWAHRYIHTWASNTFGPQFADEISDIQDVYYMLQASGKDSHVYFVNYSEDEIDKRLADYDDITLRASALMKQIPDSLKNAYFELVLYPVRGASLLNKYQLLSRRSLARASAGKSEAALRDALHARQAHTALNEWTAKYNKEIKNGKWDEFFDWHPYHWTRSTKMDAPMATEELTAALANAPKPRFVSTKDAMSESGVDIESDTEGEIPIWIEALTPIQNFSKAPENNIFCTVETADKTFTASATPINNIWHAPYVGPMWSKVGNINFKKGSNNLKLTDIKPDARIDSIYLGTYPPFPQTCKQIIPASNFTAKNDSKEGKINRIRQLGFSEGVEVLPSTTPSYELTDADAVPYVEYEVTLEEGDNEIEIRTLPTLHIYEGRDARYAVQLGDNEPELFSIHANDFTAEWRLNVLRGYSQRKIKANTATAGKETLRFYFLDPGIVLQEIRVNQPINTLTL